jgi:arylsulfatase
MRWTGRVSLALATVATLSGLAGAPAAKAQEKKPNIVVIMGDDIGIWNIGAYHQGLMAGRTPNLDKLASEGMRFTDYYAEASCTAGRANFITGELPIRTGMTTVTSGRRHWHTRSGSDHCHRTQVDGLRYWPVRQEPSRRSQ